MHFGFGPVCVVENHAKRATKNLKKKSRKIGWAAF